MYKTEVTFSGLDKDKFPSSPQSLNFCSGRLASEAHSAAYGARERCAGFSLPLWAVGRGAGEGSLTCGVPISLRW